MRDTESTSRTPVSAVRAALALLARRDLSVRQLRDRLRTRGFDPGAVEAAIASLHEQGALDDRRVALTLARRDAAVKRYGPRRIVQRLAALGIDDATAQRAVREALADVDEPTALQRAAERWLSGKRLDLRDRSVVRRLHQHLVRRGFSPASTLSFLRSRARSEGATQGEDLDE